MGCNVIHEQTNAEEKTSYVISVNVNVLRGISKKVFLCQFERISKKNA